MTHIFHAGFDDLDASTDLSLVEAFTVISGTPTLSSTTRYSNGKSLSLSNAGVSILFAEQSGFTCYFSIAVDFATLVAGSQDTPFITFQDAASNNQCALRIYFNGLIELINGSTVLATTTVTLGVWHIFDIEVLISNTGTFKLAVDGVANQINFSGDTQALGTGTFRVLKLFSQPSCTILFDDIIMQNNQGSLNNTAPGEVVCRMIYPTSDTSVQFTRNTGASDFAAIDDLVGAPDDDTTYTESAILLNKNVHGMGTLTNVGTVKAVKEIVRSKKTDVGVRTLRAGIKSGATEQTFDIGVAASYGNSVHYFETSDGATTQFNQGTIDSIELTFQDFL